MNYRKYLTEDILPFWLKHGIDKSHGGIFTQIDKNGNITDQKKAIWFVGRSLWTFAMAFNTIEPKKEYLEACETLYSFYKSCSLPDGRLPYLTTRKGEMIEKREAFHSEAFAAMGCAQYYKACKRQDVKKAAIRFFDIVYDIYNKKKTTTMVSNDEIRYNILGPEMMMVNVSQFMRNAGIEDKRFEQIANEAIDNIKAYGFIDDKNCRINEYAPCESSKKPHKTNEYSCFGHLYETAWFLLSEGEARNDDEIRKLGKKFIDYALCMEKEEAMPPVRTSNSGFEYVWWVQCEALAAFALGYNIFGEDVYREYKEKIESFVFEHFADRENGEWYSACNKDGSITNTNKGGLFKGPFHLPRMLMALISIEETGNILRYLNNRDG